MGMKKYEYVLIVFGLTVGIICMSRHCISFCNKNMAQKMFWNPGSSDKK